MGAVDHACLVFHELTFTFYINVSPEENRQSLPDDVFKRIFVKNVDREF